ADPTATILAASAQQIAEFVGLPEAQLPLAQAAIYVACAPKSNASSAGMFKALQAVENEPIKAVPLHLKDSHSTGVGKAGEAAHYRYPHDDPRGFVVQEYLPGPREPYYSPTDRGREKNIRLYLQSLQSLIQDQGRTDDRAGA
ncbi:MAG: replication-associated recombination protein A, partial [Planctomycetes bacterium]|nr:replication-associated recombination protein A [Planctomycetota bacterium]